MKKKKKLNKRKTICYILYFVSAILTLSSTESIKSVEFWLAFVGMIGMYTIGLYEGTTRLPRQSWFIEED